MVAVSTVEMPRCGLHRTTRELPGTSEVPAGILVNFHDHDGEGPVVHLPLFNSFNRWQWEKKPRAIRERSWVETLRPLPAEGYYLLREEARFDEARWPERSLVQLGYDRAGMGILFLAQRRFQLAENTLFFAERGMPFAHLDALEPLVVHAEPDPNAAGGEAPVRR